MVAFFDWLDLLLQQNAGPFGAVLTIIGMFAMGVAIVEWEIARDE